MGGIVHSSPLMSENKITISLKEMTLVENKK
jgi:hypothetical protein